MQSVIRIVSADIDIT